MLLECLGDMGPHLLKVPFSILGKEGGEGALFSEGLGHVSWFELLYLPVVYVLTVPSFG